MLRGSGDGFNPGATGFIEPASASTVKISASLLVDCSHILPSDAWIVRLAVMALRYRLIVAVIACVNLRAPLAYKDLYPFSSPFSARQI